MTSVQLTRVAVGGKRFELRADPLEQPPITRNHFLLAPSEPVTTNTSISVPLYGDLFLYKHPDQGGFNEWLVLSCFFSCAEGDQHKRLLDVYEKMDTGPHLTMWVQNLRVEAVMNGRGFRTTVQVKAKESDWLEEARGERFREGQYPARYVFSEYSDHFFLFIQL